jgi:hypothetical protein
MSDPSPPTPEALARAILEALQAEGFDAFNPGGYYDISEQVWPILVRVLREALGPEPPSVCQEKT